MADAFLVKEHVDGTNLGDLLATSGPLPALTAARIASDIVSALASAQRWGILHDDLEPADIFITPSGRAQIADSAASYAVGAGETIDLEGDLHSLGGLLLEMVAPDIPSGLGPIIQRLVSTDPAVSYPSINAVEADLHSFVAAIGGANYQPGGAPTGEVAAIQVSPPEQRRDGSGITTSTFSAINPVPERVDWTQAEPPDEEFEDDLSGNPLFLVSLAALLVVLIGLTIYLAAAISGPSQDNATDMIDVPTVIGDTPEVAIRRLVEAGFVVEEVTVENDEFAAGTVFAQNPLPRAEMEPGGTIMISVAQATATVIVPDVVDKLRTEASQELSALGFTVRIQRAPDDVIELDRVVEQSITGGQEVAEGGEITLVISSGPEQVLIPDLAGFTLAEATHELAQLGFQTVRTESEPSQAVARDSVIRTEPPPGTQVELIAPIVVIVSTANEDLVPPVFGESAEAAHQQLTSQGFNVNVEFVEVDPESGQVGIVISQSPEASTLAQLGSTVTIRVGREPGFDWFGWWKERRGD